MSLSDSSHVTPSELFIESKLPVGFVPLTPAFYSPYFDECANAS